MAILHVRAQNQNCMKRMEASACFTSVEEVDIATLLSNKDSLNTKIMRWSSTVLLT